MNTTSIKIFFIRLKYWEYWNSKFVYFPLYPFWLWLSIKARSIYFLTAANPSIKNGGYIMESKYDVYQLLPKQLYPKTIYINPVMDNEKILNIVQENQLTYPFIAKPDIGERGLGVKKIDNKIDLLQYTEKMKIPYLLQEFANYENEVGIFYCKPPKQGKGFITGIVNKESVKIVGDGNHTLEQLVFQNDRYVLQWDQIKVLFKDLLTQIVPKDYVMELIPYGNHSRGSKFTDASDKISSSITQVIQNIAEQIPEFYYGRLDIRFKSWDLLAEGKEFSIIELNGSGSEPTHIYDPKHSIFFAWQEITKHWKILYEISNYNNKKGKPYLSFSAAQQETKAFKKIEQFLKSQVW